MSKVSSEQKIATFNLINYFKFKILQNDKFCYTPVYKEVCTAYGAY